MGGDFKLNTYCISTLKKNVFMYTSVICSTVAATLLNVAAAGGNAVYD